MVASFDATVLRTVAIEVVSNLWANDISADLAGDTASLEELLTRYKDDNHSWVVIVKQDSMDRGLRVKSLQRKEDFEVRSSELVSWIRNEIRARNQREHVTEPPKLVKHSSQPDANSAARSRDPDVRILTPLHKSKKTNRRNVVESGKWSFVKFPFFSW